MYTEAAKKWYENQFTYIWVFNTGRGLSVCIKLPQGHGVVYDLGSSDEFSPTKFMLKNILPHLKPYDDRPISQTVLSHPHADHITEISALLPTQYSQPAVKVALLTCPNDKSNNVDDNVNFSRLENKDNKEIIALYKSAYSERSLPLQTISKVPSLSTPNVEYGLYYLKPGAVANQHPKDDQKYGNGLSILIYIRHGNQNMLIAGDVTPEVLVQILNDGPSVEKRFTYFGNAPEKTPGDFHSATTTQPSLKKLLSTRPLNVLIAPHHGLESCFCQELFDAMKDHKPDITVISEKRHLSETDGKVDERYCNENYSRGLTISLDGGISEVRRSVSTRNGHHILLVFKGTNNHPYLYLRKRPEDLLEM